MSYSCSSRRKVPTLLFVLLAMTGSWSPLGITMIPTLSPVRSFTIRETASGTPSLYETLAQAEIYDPATLSGAWSDA